ncbi:MAG: hypothetical protein JSV24_00295 [Bacteroidales bacterium]|nr:MAG: hypothetical protein JSV24_00295 [Bacteroidales bacterium]
MKKITGILILTGSVLFVILSCQKIESLSEIPYIEFKSFTIRDTVDLLGNPGKVGELVFRFEDGDGDIGLYPPDTLFGDSENYNLFFLLYEKIDGVFVQVPEEDLETPLNYRIPFIEKEGQNKTLKGEIKVDFLYLLMLYDTIQYEFYLIDRAFHKSNVEKTPEIPFAE